MTQSSHFHVVIPASGSGTRTGLKTPKQFQIINGKTILQHSIDIFDTHPYCASITVALNPEDIKINKAKIRTTKPLTIIPGGKERKDSIYNALKNIPNAKPDDVILIHDAARPYLHQEDLNQILSAYTSSPSCITIAKKLNDTHINKHSHDRIDRDQFIALQTPQAFPYSVILKGHELASKEQEHTDDTSIVKALGHDIKIVIAKHYNEKITFKSDLDMAEKLLTPTQYEYRTGQGFDVHAFASKDDKRPLVLCGVNVPHEQGLAGHSDADVGLHTITDAILGSIAEGDIGRHFPPSDNKFKDMDSSIFLEKARDLVASKNATIVNIDATIICEQPKITPHAKDMINRVAEILNISTDRVSIKATTTEKLGFTGRKEGIAAQAIATVKVPV